MKTLTFLALLAIFVTLASCQGSYSYTFDTLRRNVPYYSLGFLNGGHTIMINLTTPGSTFDFTSINLAVSTDSSSTITPISCSAIDGCNSGDKTCTQTCPLTVSTYYKLVITRTNTPDDNGSPSYVQFYNLLVNTYLTSAGTAGGLR